MPIWRDTRWVAAAAGLIGAAGVALAAAASHAGGEIRKHFGEGTGQLEIFFCQTSIHRRAAYKYRHTLLNFYLTVYPIRSHATFAAINN